MATILNVAPNTTIGSAWGNSVADELNTGVLKLAGGTLTGDLTLRNANPTAANHAARKQYVDERDALKLGTAGGTMTSTLVINAGTTTQCLLLRSQATGAGGSFSNSPYLSFFNNAQTVRFGYIQGTSAYLNIVSDTGDINLNSGGGQVRTSDAIYAVGGGRFFAAAGSQVQLVGTSSRAYMAFYGNGSSVDSVGVRQGYIGYPDTGHLYIKNEVASASIVHQAGYGHTFSCANLEVARIVPTVMMVGKSNASITVAGISLYETGSIYSTRGTGTGSPLYLNFQNGVDGNYLATFMRNGVGIGRIEQEGTTGVKLVSGSDRRMKNILGPITDAIERVKALKTYKVSYKGDPARDNCDAFIADEVMDIVPEAVSGMPNEVAGPPASELDPPEGTPIYQGMAYEKLITVTVAALQNIIGRVEALEGA